MSLRCGWAGRAAVMAAAVEAALVLSVGAFALGGSPTLPVPYSSVTPTIDGQLGVGEWSDAAQLSMPFSGHPGVLFAKHDTSYLYVLLLVPDNPPSSATPYPNAIFYFDNNHDGVLESPEDIMTLPHTADAGVDLFFNGGGSQTDTSDGGINDVTGSGSYDSAGSRVIIEGRKPLCSTDTAHDFCVTDGSTLGFTVRYTQSNKQFSYYPVASNDPGHYADLVLAPATADLSITKTVDKASVDVGEQATYTIVAKNNGPAAATNVVVSDTQTGSGVSFMPGALVPSVGACTGSSCSLGSLGPGATATITQTVTPTSAATGGGTIHDAATVSSAVQDPNPADDTAALTVAVRPPMPQGGQTVVAQTTGGTILVRRPGGDFVALERGAPIPLGSEVDATNGTVVITSQAPDGSLQTATVSEGMFVVNQLPGKALTTLRLRPPYSCTRVGPVRRLLVDANGKFRTLGARGWAMPLRQQAVWLTVDSCVRVKHRALSVAGKKKLKKRTCYTKLGRRSDFVYDPEHRPPTFPPKKKRYCEPA